MHLKKIFFLSIVLIFFNLKPQVFVTEVINDTGSIMRMGIMPFQNVKILRAVSLMNGNMVPIFNEAMSPSNNAFINSSGGSFGEMHIPAKTKIILSDMVIPESLMDSLNPNDNCGIRFILPLFEQTNQRYPFLILKCKGNFLKYYSFRSEMIKRTIDLFGKTIRHEIPFQHIEGISNDFLEDNTTYSIEITESRIQGLPLAVYIRRNDIDVNQIKSEIEKSCPKAFISSFADEKGPIKITILFDKIVTVKFWNEFITFLCGTDKGKFFSFDKFTDSGNGQSKSNGIIYTRMAREEFEQIIRQANQKKFKLL